MKKGVRILIKATAITLASIVGLFLLLYAVLAIIRAAAYKESNGIREYVCTIPEIGSGYAPQGIAYSAEKDLYLMTGYDGNNESVLYAVKDNKPTRILIADANGNPLKGHAGGITVTKDYVYIANASKLTYYSLDALLSATERVSPLGVKPVDNNASYVFSDESKLYVGEFYRAGNYETSEAHYYTAPDGTQNKAIVSCYPLDETGKISADYPEYSVSIPGLVQGIAVHNGGKMVLSRSYGLTNSKLDYYAAPTEAGTITLSFKHDKELGSVEVPLYYLDKLEKSLTLPSFSEDLTIADGKLIVTTESACNKYIVGKLFGADKVYAYPLTWDEAE